ncbi:hypothetical protein QOT17_002122 [Balamuthia mandrillaris]
MKRCGCCARVGCFMLGPLYFAARLPGSIYVNDGSIVPDWGHLLYSPEEMLHLLKQRLPPQEQPLVNVAVDLIYSAPHINRLPQRAYDEVLDGFVEQGAVRILVRECYGPTSTRHPKGARSSLRFPRHHPILLCQLRVGNAEGLTFRFP